MYFLSAVASGCTFCCFSILVIRTFLFLILLRKRWKSCQLQPAACPLIQGSTGKERKKKRRRRKKRGKRAPFSGSVVKPDKLLFRNFGIVISVRHKVLGHCYKKQPQLTWLGHVIHSKEHKSSSSGRHLHGRTFLLSHFESLLSEIPVYQEPKFVQPIFFFISEETSLRQFYNFLYHVPSCSRSIACF